MLAAIQFYGQHRCKLAPFPLIDHKIEASRVKQINCSRIIPEHMGNRDFSSHHASAIRNEYIVQRMVEILQKSRFCFCAVWFNSKSTRRRRCACFFS